MMKLHGRVPQMRARLLLTAGVAATAVLCSLLIFAYTPEQDDVGNAPVATRWPGNSVNWSLNSNPVPSNVNTAGGDSLATALGKAFLAWPSAQVNGQAVAQLTVTGPGSTTLTNPDPMNASDCVNIVSFVDTNTNDFPASSGAIAFAAVATVFASPGQTPPFSYPCVVNGQTTPHICPLQSCIIDVDIMFSPKQQFSTLTPLSSSAFDVQSIATHEVGHMLGLDHSGIAAAVMYPFGDTGQSQHRTLAVDDAVGIAFIYPAGPPCMAGTIPYNCSLGVISGRVTMNNSGIFASHVVAVDSTTGSPVIDGLTEPDGTYKLIGVPPGSYNVLALPLAPDSNSGIYTLSDFGGWSCGYAGTTENSPPCCDPATDTTCTGTSEPKNPTNYTGAFF